MSGRNARHDQATIDWLRCDEPECPPWWQCGTRGCYAQAKSNYANGIDRKPLPGDPGYLTTSSRTEDRIEQAVYGGGPIGKRSTG